LGFPKPVETQYRLLNHDDLNSNDSNTLVCSSSAYRPMRYFSFHASEVISPSA